MPDDPVATAGARVPLPASDRTPWIIAAVLAVLTIVAVLYAANRRAHPAVPLMANAGNAAPGAETPAGPAGRPPDLSTMTPREQFTRLSARIAQALEKADTATVVNFTPMAFGAYANLPDGDRDIDVRYQVAMLQAQVGMFPEARAMADTIMKFAPDNLLGYYIRATVAEFAGDSAQARAARAAFRAHYDAQLKTARPEYTAHLPFLEQYRKGNGAK